MYSDLESNESRRREVVSCLYWSLMNGWWDIPPEICDFYGFTKDYQLYHHLENMDAENYRQMRQSGELPDILEVDAKLTRVVEKVFERVCHRPPNPYLDRLNEELERLGRIAAQPDFVHDIIHIRPDFLAKYGIDRNAPEDAIRKQAEKAYRELDSRFVRMTGRRSYADGLFGRFKTKPSESPESSPRRKPHITVRPKPKGRKMGL